MSFDKTLKSPASDDSSSLSAAPSKSNISDHDLGKINATTTAEEGADKKINLNDFLDFLKVSCHVNDMIASSSGGGNGQPKETSTIVKTAAAAAEVDFDKLAGNRLVNDLFGHPQILRNTVVGCQELHEDFTDRSSGSSGAATERSRTRRRNSSLGPPTMAGYSRNSFKKPDTPRMTGLHPKLNEKLDYVINEGVLDSVLPFICPVPLPATFPNRVKVTKPTPREMLAGGGKTAAASATGTAGGDDSTIATTKTMPAGEAVSKQETDAATSLDTSGGGAGKPREHSRQSSFMRRKSLSHSKSDKEKKEPEVVIHVCDEVKNISRDFTCSQNLLVSKMGYFADVTAGQKLEDMDISVHCDIQIFDWLMKWVRHNAQVERDPSGCATAALQGPQLDASNVVPILVSASFLQMEPLLLDCLSFCHARLGEVVRTSTNLSCLNDSIVTRLAAMFTNLELEMVRDKKERVTPRLWTKLIQSLCEPEPEALRGHYYSLSGLFRCSKCGKCLTNTMKSYIACLPTNTRLNRWGQLVFHHVRDAYWDINGFITQLFKELKSWRRVYWKLWGHCHFLYCCICETHFPVFQMNWCRFHPESPNFLGPVTEGRIAGPAGRYPCCGQQAFRFETLPGPNGCQFREHSVLVETDRERAILALTQLVAEGYGLCEDPPLKLQEQISSGDVEPRWTGLSLTPQRCRQGLLPVLNPEESSSYTRLTRRGAPFLPESSTETDTSDTLEEERHQSRRYLSGAASCDYSSSSSDGCESECSAGGRKVFYTKKGKKRQSDIPGRYWSGELSARSNQDHQREFEEKVMKQVVGIVNKKTGSENSLSQHAQPVGGAYVRLEAEWKDQLKQRNSNNNSSSHSHNNATSSSQLIVAKQKNK